MNKIYSVIFAVAAFFIFSGASLAAAADVNPDVNPTLTNLQLWSIIAGVVTSFVSAVIAREAWTSSAKLACFSAFSVVMAAITAHFKGDLNLHDFERSLLIVLAAGIATYKATAGAMQEIHHKTG